MRKRVSLSSSETSKYVKLIKPKLWQKFKALSKDLTKEDHAFILGGGGGLEQNT
jgi:hypothetical protein